MFSTVLRVIRHPGIFSKTFRPSWVRISPPESCSVSTWTASDWSLSCRRTECSGLARLKGGGVVCLDVSVQVVGGLGMQLFEAVLLSAFHVFRVASRWACNKSQTWALSYIKVHHIYIYIYKGPISSLFRCYLLLLVPSIPRDTKCNSCTKW